MCKGYIIEKDFNYRTIKMHKAPPNIIITEMLYYISPPKELLEEIVKKCSNIAKKIANRYIGINGYGYLEPIVVVNYGWSTGGHNNITTEIYFKFKNGIQLNGNEKHKRVMDTNSIERKMLDEICMAYTNYFKEINI